MSFGYSFGDFVAGANISYRLIQVLSQSQGASIEYQEAISELATLQQTFLQVGYMRPSKHLSQATINAASHIVLSSMDLIGDFLAKTKRYRERLCGRGPGNSVSDSWQKMGWVLFKKDELKELRDTLNLKLSNIGVLLSTAHFHGRIPSQIAKYEVKTPDIDTFRTPSPPPSYVNKIPEAEIDSPTTPSAKPMTRYISTSEGATEDDGSGKSSAISEIEARFARLEELFMQQNKPGLPNADGTQNATLIENQSAINEEFVSLEESLEQQNEDPSPATSESQIRQPTSNKASTLSSEVLTRFEQFLKSHENEESQQSKLISRLESMLASKGDAQDGSAEKLQKPIKFKDAVGRKFSFPFHLCQTWGGMEELIKQAFLHVDVIGPHVHEGHYDILAPNGEIILPQVWETMIQPDWSITMHMWPIPDPKPPPPRPPPPGFPPNIWQSGPPSRPSQRPGASSSKSRPAGFARPYKARSKPMYMESDDSDQEEVKQGSKGVMRWMSKANQMFKKKPKESKYSESYAESSESYTDSSLNSIIID